MKPVNVRVTQAILVLLATALLVMMGCPVHAQCEALVNGNFEFKDLGWKSGGVKDDKDAYEGSYALKISEKKSASQTVAVLPDQKYTLNFYGKIDNNKSWAVAGVEYLDASRNHIKELEQVLINTKSYERYSFVDFQVDVGVAFVKVYFKVGATGNKSPLLVDNVCLSLLNPTTVWKPEFNEAGAASDLDLGGQKLGGMSFYDYDDDGHLDLLVNTYDNAHGSYLMHNDGDATFTNVTAAKAPHLSQYVMERSAVWGDLNNDGYVDFIRNRSTSEGTRGSIQIYFQDPATRNFGDGIGGFAPITAGDPGDGCHTDVYDGINAEGLGLVDFDGDGDLDIIFDNHNFGIDILRNNYIDHTTRYIVAAANSALFTHATRRNGSTVVLGLGQVATDGDYGAFVDLDDDGWVDIFMRKRDENDVFVNLGGTFANGQDLGQANNDNKGSNAIYDFDNDGDYDVFWTENGPNQLFRNDAGTWTPLGASGSTGIPTTLSTRINEAAGGDIDNDGDIDLLLVGDGRSFLYINQINDPVQGANVGTPLTFVLDDTYQFSNGNGAYSALMVDIDNDGDLDIYFNRSSGNRLFINDLYDASTTEYSKNALRVKVWDDRSEYMQPGTRRPATGATVVLKDCFGNVLSGTREVSGGNSRGTQNPHDIHFGLPYYRNYNYVVEVRYPNYKRADGTIVRTTISKHFNPSDFGAAAPIIVFTTGEADTECPDILEICDNGLDDDGDGNIDCPSVYGSVFEDVNYGGGQGRTYAEANTAAQLSGYNDADIVTPAVLVELYDVAGDYMRTVTTLADGSYTLDNVGHGDFYIRVVTSTVISVRASKASGEIPLPVLTYRKGNAIIRGEVGGASPELPDAPANTSAANLATLTTATYAPHAITKLAIGGIDMTEMDFGFSFSTITNTNPNGQGSLRQFLLNTHELSSDNLDLEDSPVGAPVLAKAATRDVSIFMIPGTNVHRINTQTLLPTVTSDRLMLTGYTQPGSTRGNVGSRTIKIELNGNNVNFDGINVQAANVDVSGLSIGGYRRGIVAGSVASSELFIWGNNIGTNAAGHTALNNSSAGIHLARQTGAQVGSNADGINDIHEGNLISGNDKGLIVQNSSETRIMGNRVGTNAAGTAQIKNRNIGLQIRDCPNGNVIGFDDRIAGLNATVARNIISGNGSDGVRISNSNNQIITGNFIGTDVTGNTALANTTNGIVIDGNLNNTTVGTNGDGNNDLTERNIISGNGEDGIRIENTNSVAIAGNYIGVAANGTKPLGNGKRGIIITGASSDNLIGYHTGMSEVNSRIVGNVIRNNIDVGIALSGNGERNRLSRNRLGNNASIGIDLGYDLVTANDNGDTDTGTNTLLNFPVINHARLKGNRLRIRGTAPANSVLEIFTTDTEFNPNPLPPAYTTSFGEGVELVTVISEGKGDLATGTLDYQDDGTGATTMKTEAAFDITTTIGGLISLLSPDMNLTCTATDALGNTSEFSGRFRLLFTEICDNLTDDDGDGLIDGCDQDCPSGNAVARVSH